MKSCIRNSFTFTDSLFEYEGCTRGIYRVECSRIASEGAEEVMRGSGSLDLFGEMAGWPGFGEGDRGRDPMVLPARALSAILVLLEVC